MEQELRKQGKSQEEIDSLLQARYSKFLELLRQKIKLEKQH
jgi:hypothetical protein